jgi:cell division protein FtsZ
MSHRGLALLGVGQGKGEEAASEAMEDAINSPLLEDMSIDGAMGVLVHFYIHPDYPMLQISEAMNIVFDSADEDSDVIFGTTTDPSIPLDSVKITIVATGFEKGELEKFDDTPVKQTTAEFIRPTLGLGRVSGSDLSDYSLENLETPSYIRNQMD